MADYIYTAVGRDGKQTKGSVTARDLQRARMQLKEQGLTPLTLNEASVMNKDINIKIGGGVGPRDLSLFCRQFSSILNAGVTIVDGLMMLGDQIENKTLKEAVKNVQMAVEKGETLSSAMKANTDAFPAMLINMIEAGEISGSLETSLNRMGTQFEKSARLKSLIKKAMIYPIVVIVVAFIVVIVMSLVVVPQFATMFQELGTELPFATRIVMAFSNFVLHKWYILIAIVVGGFVGIKLFAKTEMGMRLFGRLAMKLPLFGKLTVKNASASFSRTLSTLVSSGISITEALSITSRSMKNIWFREAVEAARADVERGVLLSEPIKRCGLFPPMIHQMIKIGEETGNMEEMLDKAAEYYEEEVEIATQGLTSAMEPLIILVLGVVVGVIVLALYQPMIGMYSGLDNL